MTIGTIKTQGTKLYLVDTLTASEATVAALACPTGITGLGGAADNIEDTCLDTIGDKTYQGGLGNPGAISVPFNFIPSAFSQQVLFDLKTARTVIPWMIGFSDGVTAPTLSGDDELVAPAGRTSAAFDAYVADVNIDVATNEIVRGTLTLQRSGSVEWAWNGPVPA